MRYASPVGIMFLVGEGHPAGTSLAGERREAVRFGIEVPQDAPFPALVECWHRVEELGFDHLWVADHSADTRTDHSGDYRNLDGTWFDGWTVLAIMAKETTGIRIGTLVSNPVLRPPALLAKEALTVDHLSEGRLELGIGTGIEPLDHATMGSDYWSPGERVARFSEYVEVVDGLLANPSRAYAFEGRFLPHAGGSYGTPARSAAATADHRWRSVTDRLTGRRGAGRLLEHRWAAWPRRGRDLGGHAPAKRPARRDVRRLRARS
jgi:alkanesulfonate monooxygenase SsuD/methylene tetrahydromethanopterin reductase-like flavin-dependent oxidoreductase (luciferase family)